MEFGEEGGQIRPDAGNNAEMRSPHSAAGQGMQPGTTSHAKMDLLAPGDDVINENIGNADDEISHVV